MAETIIKTVCARLSVFAAALVLTVLLCGAGIHETAPETKALTLMIYLCGSDLESKAGAASKDLDEILSSGVDTDAVNVVVMAGGTVKWQNEFPEKETALYAVVSGDPGQTQALQWEKIRDFSAPDADAPANMGAGDTLRDFLNISYEMFPAEEYALILWDHGGGPLRGLCWDTAWSKDNLSMDELTEALEESPFKKKKLSWIGFDACLMASIETAHLVSPYADYMIASEETEPSMGWPYTFLNGIEEDKSGAVTGTRVVDAYFAAGENTGKDYNLTLSCSNLSFVKNVEEKMEAFFSEITAELDETTFSEFSNMRQNTREFGKALTDSQRMDLVDLGDLIGRYSSEAPKEADALDEALNEMVVCCRSNLENCNGLSSYHPYYNKTYYEKMWQKEYDSFGFVPSYTAYIHDFAGIWLDDALGDWTQMNQVQTAGVQDEIQYFSVQLTPEQLDYYASGELLLLTSVGYEDGQDGIGYAQVYTTNDVTVDDSGILTAGYNGKTLYVMDDQGEIVGGPLNYTVSDEGNIQILANYINDESGTQRLVTYAMFECADAPSGTELQILDQYVFDDDTGMWSNRLELHEEQCQLVNFLFSYKSVTYDEDGRILPFSEWKNSNWLGGYTVDLPASLHFQFIDHNLQGRELSACFQISDTQANVYGTELMPVENVYVTPLRFDELNQNGNSPNENRTGKETSCVFETEQLRMTFSGMLNNSEYMKGLELTVQYENISGERLSAPQKDGLRLTGGDNTRICFPKVDNFSVPPLDPGENVTVSVFLEEDMLRGLSRIQNIGWELEIETGEEQETSEDLSDGEEKRLLLQDLIWKPVNLDLSILWNDEQNRSALAEYTEAPLHWTLLTAERQSGDLTAAVLCKNEGPEEAAMPCPEEAAVNGIVLPVNTGMWSESVVLQPGEECAFFATLSNESYFWEAYDHLSGLYHLRIDDLLGSFGVHEVNELTLYSETSLYGWEEPAGHAPSSIVPFSLKSSIRLAGPDEESKIVEQNDTGEVDSGMTRALDTDNRNLSRIKLYSRDGISVYGEYILIADRSLLLSLVLENGESRDAVLRFYNWEINSTEDESGGYPADSYINSYIIREHTRKRVILEKKFELDGKTDDRIERLSMYVRQETLPPETGLEKKNTELPVTYGLSFSFDRDTAFNKDGGELLPVEETHPESVFLTDTAGSGPVFAKAVGVPEGSEIYTEELVFSLSDLFGEEEWDAVAGVRAIIGKKYTDKIPPEDEDTWQFGLQPLAVVPMQKTEKQDIYTGKYSGLVCVMDKDPSINIIMEEYHKAPFGMDFYSYADSSFQNTRLYLKPEFMDDYSMWRAYACMISLYGTGEKRKAELARFVVFDDQGKDGVSDMPAVCFTSLEYDGYTYFWHEKQGSFSGTEKEMLEEAQTYKGEHKTYMTDGEPIGLRLIPATEYAPDITVLYQIVFDDGTVVYCRDINVEE